jgi:hypothetical protein
MNTRRKLVINAGDVFGRLTAVRSVSERGGRWLFHCACGTEKELSRKHVTDGVTTSCGCWRQDVCAALGGSRGRVADFTGERFGYLTAVRFIETGKRGARWMFRCDCGTELVLNAKDIRYGHRKSCGCKQYAGTSQRIDVRADTGMPGVRGLTPEQLADLAAGFGVDGPADGLLSFAAEMQTALIRSCGIPAYMLEVRQ